ncbi:MAG TPA: PTS sugar transporter subunit IIA [Elusimicrobiota bacterium]|nr:PTS sugar transporter subunit IIA [Elusimicrobiota bacterium]
MKSLLNALQEGRLVELPDEDKEKSLEYLAHLIEAVPDLAGSPELAEEMIARERTHNTGIGSGVACPHVRATGGGDLLCAVGWTPTGIDYGASDGKKVHLIVMYFIPDAQKNVYLKEISSLASAIRREDGIQSIATAEDIATVRERLLDWVQATIDASVPETKARMIRLEARQAVAEAGPAAPGGPAAPLQVLTAQFLVADGRTIALCSSAELAAELEKDADLPAVLRQRGQFERAGWRFVFRDASIYGARTLYDYTAVK